MKNLKYLMFDGVKLTGSYQNFPNLRWLRWHRCNMKTIPPGLLGSNLVSLDMSFGDLEKFDPPTVLNSLKFLDLSDSNKLVGICNLYRLPELETLNLISCTSLTHVCKTIGDLEWLLFIFLTRSTMLWMDSCNQTFENEQERVKAFCTCEETPEQPLLSLPQMLSTLVLAGSQFEMMPSNIDLSMLVELDLSSCSNLKSLPCLPSELTRLHVEWCTSLERIAFQSARFTLQTFTYEGCFKLSEIEGLFKLVSIAKLDETDLKHMQWIKEYQNHKVDLVGDVITKGRTFNIQMLYEYGIRSTYLQGVKDQSMEKHEYKSSSGFLSCHVPSHTKNHRIHGLNVTFIYRSTSGDKDTYMQPILVAQISNRTKGFSWVYNPVVYCKAMVDNDVVWLSYWPIGNKFDSGDEVQVNFLVDQRVMIARGCGASFVYMYDGDVEKEEVIGGDLSLFEVIKGCYYFCRHDHFNSVIPDWLFGENIQITDSRRWRESGKSRKIYETYIEHQNPNLDNIEVEVAVSFNSKSEINEIEKAVSTIVGVESVTIRKEQGRLIVRGRFDPQAIVTRVKNFEKIVQILDLFYYC